MAPFSIILVGEFCVTIYSMRLCPAGVMSSSCLSSVMFALMFAISVLFYAAKIGAFNAEIWQWILSFRMPH